MVGTSAKNQTDHRSLQKNYEQKVIEFVLLKSRFCYTVLSASSSCGDARIRFPVPVADPFSSSNRSIVNDLINSAIKILDP